VQVGQDRADESDDGVGEDADDSGSAFDLVVDPPQADPTTSGSTGRSAAAPTSSASSSTGRALSGSSAPSSPSNTTNGPKVAVTSASRSSTRAQALDTPNSEEAIQAALQASRPDLITTKDQTSYTTCGLDLTRQPSCVQAYTRCTRTEPPLNPRQYRRVDERGHSSLR
jgi:hypothetical protein